MKILRHGLDPVLARFARPRDESGAAAVFVIGVTLVMLACAGLVLDGGQALNARMRLADDLEQAARAGAQQIDVIHLREHGVVRLDSGAAEARAAGFIGSSGYTDVRVRVDREEITVSAKDSVDTDLLSLIGIQRFDVKASATSQAVTQ